MTEQRYVIEVGGDPTGVVVEEHSGFRFFAAAAGFSALDRHVFRSPGQAEDACREIALTRSAPKSTPQHDAPQWDNSFTTGLREATLGGLI